MNSNQGQVQIQNPNVHEIHLDLCNTWIYLAKAVYFLGTVFVSFTIPQKNLVQDLAS